MKWPRREWLQTKTKKRCVSRRLLVYTVHFVKGCHLLQYVNLCVCIEEKYAQMFIKRNFFEQTIPIFTLQPKYIYIYMCVLVLCIEWNTSSLAYFIHFGKCSV